MRINSSSSSTKTTTTPKISEKSFNHSKKLENFWRKIFFSSSNFNQLSGSKKILHNSFWEIWHKNFKSTRGCKHIQHINFQNVKRTRGCSHKYFRKLRNKCKTKNIFGQQTKEAHQHISFQSSNQHFEANFNNIFKENRRSFSSRTTQSSRTKHRDKTASSLIKSISINVFLPKGRDWPFLVILGSSERPDKDGSRSLRN